MPYKGKHVEHYFKTEIQQSDLLLAKVLKDARHKGKLTQKELGLMLGISNVMVHYIESGNYRGIKYFRYLPRLYKYLKCCNCVLTLDILVLSDSEDTKPKQRIRKRKGINTNILP